MKQREILLTIDSLREQDLSFREITEILQKEGCEISKAKVWYLVTFGSRNPGYRKCCGPNCSRTIRKISNTKYCSISCKKAAKKERENRVGGVR